MRRFVVFSDLHLHEFDYGSKLIDGWNSRLLEQDNVLAEIEAYMCQHGIEDVVFCGDMFHRFGTLTAPVLHVAVNRFSWWKNHGFNIYFLVGNHDMYSKNGSIHALKALSPFAKWVADAPITLEMQDELPMTFIPYTEDAAFLQKELAKAPQNAMIFLHQGVAGVPMGSGYVINEIFHPDMIPSHAAVTFTGHYHIYKRIAPRAFIVGAPIQQNFGDAGNEMGFLDVDPEAGMMVRRVITQHPQFRIVKTQDDVKLVKPGDFVRVIGDVEYDEKSERIIEVNHSSVGVMPETNPTVKSIVEQLLDQHNASESERLAVLQVVTGQHKRLA